jgi:hypothetical protein
MTAYFAVYALDRPGRLAAREAAREQHRIYLRTPNPHGVEALLGGPLCDEQGRMNGTLLVLRARSREDVERFMAADPYAAADVFERVEIRAWRWGLGAPADAAG